MPVLRLRRAIERLGEELRGRASPADVERARRALVADRATTNESDERDTLGTIRPGTSAVLVRRGADGDRGIERAAIGEADVVWLDDDVYRSIPSRAARIALLAEARAAARRHVVLRVVVSDEHSHLGRALVDAPRSLLKALGVDVAETGDRFGPVEYAHLFFDDEALLEEIDAAGLDVVLRRNATFVLRRREGAHAPERDLDPTAAEVLRVARLVALADRLRLRESPELAVRTMRERGSAERARGPIGRARLRRAIGFVDAALPGEPSCYRRTLLELGLDGAAARETIVFGLDVGRTGHVAFKDREERGFDVAFEIEPP